VSAQAADTRPLIAHVVHRFGIGGLENGLVNLVNRLPPKDFRHAVVCLTEPGEFRSRIARSDVEVVGIGKRAGKDPGAYLRLARVFARLKPAIVHTRNLGTIDCQWVAAAMGVRGRIHGEHGWDVVDLHGTNARYRRLRRMVSPFVKYFVPMSRDLARWLETDVGIPPRKIRQLYNGVDTDRFQPRASGTRAAALAEFAPPGTFLVGSVLRLEPVKDPCAIVTAFAQAVRESGGRGESLRLALIGGGPLEGRVHALVRDLGLERQCWLAGARHDVAELTASFDLFVLASLNEGISNTILEAMASGVPVVATDVGGNRELLLPGETGALVPAGEQAALAAAMRAYAAEPARARAHGEQARRHAVASFGIEAMVGRYQSLYEDVLGARAPGTHA
jgi:sugar transferase (PEP-CTERM/EpsH1 system associated)